MIILETTLGNIKLELDEANTPNTAKNFLTYVQSGFYKDTIFHRVIDGFMIQGGGLTQEMEKKDTSLAIDNEADKGGKNLKGTIAMARTNDPHSATAQFFINVADNDFLNFKNKSSDGWGYCVFGKVVEGMEVVEQIEKTPTTHRDGYADVPVEPILITNVTVVE